MVEGSKFNLGLRRISVEERWYSCGIEPVLNWPVPTIDGITGPGIVVQGVREAGFERIVVNVSDQRERIEVSVHGRAFESVLKE